MLTGLLLAAAVVSVATVAPPTATVLANRTAFNQPCVWFTSTAPDRLAATASAALERLGWTVASSVGPRFTQEVALRGIAPAGALYVHSHGDHYYDAAAKRRVLLEHKEALRLDRNQIIAAGDGANDLKMLGEAQFSVAYRAKPVVREQAAYAINFVGLDGILNLPRSPVATGPALLTRVKPRGGLSLGTTRFQLTYGADAQPR
jgi:hypothetical protein